MDVESSNGTSIEDNTAPSEPGGVKNGSYNLRKRTLVARLTTEQRLTSPRLPKPKSRPATLSKYRRKAANTRERQRMMEINEAFNKLQTVLPGQYQPQDLATSSTRTKITTLRLAVNYIAALRHVLEEETDNEEDESVSSSSNDSPIEVDNGSHDILEKVPLPISVIDSKDVLDNGTIKHADQLTVQKDVLADQCQVSTFYGNSPNGNVCVTSHATDLPQSHDVNNNVIEASNSNLALTCPSYLTCYSSVISGYSSAHHSSENTFDNICNEILGKDVNCSLLGDCAIPVLSTQTLRPPPAYPYP